GRRRSRARDVLRTKALPPRATGPPVTAVPPRALRAAAAERRGRCFRTSAPALSAGARAPAQPRQLWPCSSPSVRSTAALVRAGQGTGVGPAGRLDAAPTTRAPPARGWGCESAG